MKKAIQNILAQHSNKEIVYLCSKCGKEVNKPDNICYNCGAKLGNIRCPFCNFIGDLNDFKFDTCPRCGRKKFTKIGQKTYKMNSDINFKLSSKLFWFLFFILTAVIALLTFLFLYNFDLINI